VYEVSPSIQKTFASRYCNAFRRIWMQAMSFGLKGPADDRRPSSDGPVSAPRTPNPSVHNFHAQRPGNEFASLNPGWPTNMTLRKSVVMIRSAESN
jgi:hypothetical protein